MAHLVVPHVRQVVFQTLGGTSVVLSITARRNGNARLRCSARLLSRDRRIVPSENMGIILVGRCEPFSQTRELDAFRDHSIHQYYLLTSRHAGYLIVAAGNVAISHATTKQVLAFLLL